MLRISALVTAIDRKNLGRLAILSPVNDASTSASDSLGRVEINWKDTNGVDVDNGGPEDDQDDDDANANDDININEVLGMFLGQTSDFTKHSDVGRYPDTRASS